MGLTTNFTAGRRKTEGRQVEFYSAITVGVHPTVHTLSSLTLAPKTSASDVRSFHKAG